MCVKESVDYGSLLPTKTYFPTGPAVAPFVGRGGALVLLHELRAHRMSHYQLLGLDLPLPPPPAGP